MKLPTPAADQKRVFLRAVQKGMAAPVLLFSSFRLPESAEPKPFEPLPKREVGSVADDWRRVGEHLRAAVERAERG